MIRARSGPSLQSLTGLAVALAILLTVYYPTLLTIITGSSDDFMADVGEAQIVLNSWGTLHATGYPLFVILGNILVSAARLVGISPIVAPTLAALLWGLVALSLLYLLILRLTNEVLLAVSATVVFGLFRWVWIHNVIPEVYSFALLWFILLLLIAFWPDQFPHRLEWLALIGGIGIGHHRGLILSIPPVLIAVWPEFKEMIVRRPRHIIVLALLGLVGFVPYVYLPLRARMGGAWVYGDPSTLSGWWDQFIAREAPAILQWPDSLDIIADKLSWFNRALVDELSVPGVVFGVAGLFLAFRDARRRRIGIALATMLVLTYIFDVVLFTDILAPVIIPMTLSLLFGWVFLSRELLVLPFSQHTARFALAPLAIFAGAWYISQNLSYISTLTHDITGLETIEQARQVPAGDTLMLDWGVRYFAVGFAQDVLGDLGQIQRANAKSDLASIARAGKLVTPDYTFYLRPPAWWRKELEAPIYLWAVAPHLVTISTTINIAGTNVAASGPFDPTAPVIVATQDMDCSLARIVLSVDWQAADKPPRNLNVYAHLLDAQGALVAQFDAGAPVYGLRPLTGWEKGEVVRDYYSLERSPNGEIFEYGLYERLPNGEFRNYAVHRIPVRCGN